MTLTTVPRLGMRMSEGASTTRSTASLAVHMLSAIMVRARAPATTGAENEVRLFVLLLEVS